MYKLKKMKTSKKKSIKKFVELVDYFIHFHNLLEILNFEITQPLLHIHKLNVYNVSIIEFYYFK